MLTELIKTLQRFFSTTQTYQTELDRYISLKNPQTTSELEYWMREFDRKHPGVYHGR